MDDSTDPLVLDLVEWIAREPRLYAEVIETWRTSCPRLTIWEDAVDRGFVTRETSAGSGVRVAVTADGARFLRAHGRAGEGDKQMAEASRLHPDAWSLWRQAADLDEVGKASGPEFWKRVQALGERPYYPPPKL